MAPDRVYPDGGAAAPIPGAYYNLKNNQIPPPATYQRPGRRGRGPCCCCFAWLCSIFTILIILIGLAVLIFWLIVRPKAPQFHVERVHISGLTGTTQPFNTSIDYAIQARNPNKKMTFYYSDISVKVESSGTIVGQGTVASFSQGEKNTTELTGTITEENVSLSSDDLKSIQNDPSDVPIYAEVNLKVRVKVGSLKSNKMKVKVKCNVYADLTITSGQSQLKSSKCKVDW